MGKFFAAVIIVILFLWLAPMCARLPADLSTVSAPAAPAAPAVPAEPPAPVPVPAPAPALEPVAAPPAPKPAHARAVTLKTYLSRTMFPQENGQYIVSVLRANKADVPALGVRMTLTTRIKGQVVEVAESGPAQTLAAGSTSYFGLGVSTMVFDELLERPEDSRNALEWALTYRFDGDAPGATRCYGLRALPRRLEPAGITWLVFGESRRCD